MLDRNYHNKDRKAHLCVSRRIPCDVTVTYAMPNKCSRFSDWLSPDCASMLQLEGSGPSALHLDIEMFHAIMKTSLLT